MSSRSPPPSGSIAARLLPALATFTANWYQGFTLRLDNFSTVLWSVSVEEQFYILWPLVLARLSRDALRRLCYAMILVALASRVVFVLMGHAAAVWYLTTTHLDALALGTLLALSKRPSFVLSLPIWSLAVGACVLGFVIEVRAFANGGYDVASAVAYTAVPVIATAMVALALVPQKTPLQHPWMVGVGRTFGLCCYHMLILQFVHVRDVLHLMASLVVTFALAWTSYHLYEKRFLRLKHRFERVPSRPD